MNRVPDHIVADVKSRADLLGMVRRRVKLSTAGRGEMVGLCPFHNEKSGSFRYYPERGGHFHCFGCGAHGDAIGWVMRTDRLDFPAAVRHLAGVLGLDASAPVDPEAAARRAAEDAARDAAWRAQMEAEEAETVAKAQALWARGQTAAGTIVDQAYLPSRCITLAAPPSLRFLGAHGYWKPGRTRRERPILLGRYPVMLGGVQGPDGRVRGIHQTYLRADGSGKADVPKAKKMGGKCFGGAVRFDRAAESMGFAEGIETALSVKQSCPDLAVWAALSLGNLSGGALDRGPRHPTKPDTYLPGTKPDPARPGLLPPAGCRTITLLTDSDNGDPLAAERLVRCAARRYSDLGLRVRIAPAPEGMDWNDVLRASQKVAA